MSEIVNVLALVCAEDVLAKYGPNNGEGDPIVLGEDYGGLIVAAAYGGGQARFDLAITAPLGTSAAPTLVRWRACTLSMDAAYQCEIEKLTISAQADCLQAATSQNKSFDLYLADVEAPKDPSKLATESVVDRYWESQIKSAGTASYLVDIKITDHKGMARGYYRIGSPATGQPTVRIS